jgi:hypothetical protein
VWALAERNISEQLKPVLREVRVAAELCAGTE